MNTATEAMYTVHPFGDEWLWNADGVDGLVVNSIEDAVELATDEREDMAGSDTHGHLAADVWFEVRFYDEAQRDSLRTVGYIDTEDKFHEGEPDVDASGVLLIQS